MPLNKPLLVVWLCACSADPGPPLLPGELPPPCETLASRSFLIEQLALPDHLGFTSVPRYNVDLSDPPDLSDDAQNDPYTWLVGFVPTLPDAIQRAVDQHHVLWTITIESCEQGRSRDYARMQLRRGRTFSEVAEPGLSTVEVIDDPGTWAVGEYRYKDHRFDHGIGQAPVALGADINADTSETSWFRGYQVTMDAALDPRGETLFLTGALALAYEVEPARSAVAAATGRTLTKALADDPTCSATTACKSEFFKMLLSLDSNNDRTFTEDEVIGNVALGIFPYLDLLATYAGNLVYWPSYDNKTETAGSSYQFSAREVDITLVEL